MSEADETGGRGELLWEPSPERYAASRMAHFMRWLERDGGQHFESYADLWRWSVEQVGPFWQAIARSFAVPMGGQTYLSIRFFLFGDDAAATVAKVEPEWKRWFGEKFPMEG